MINIPGLINLDFADVSSIMKDAGYAHMGVGRASGRDKAEAAALMAISSPLLETTINGAKGVIINITSSSDIDLNDIELAASMMTDAAHADANIIWGAAFDEKLQDEMLITVIATGFDSLTGTTTNTGFFGAQTPKTTSKDPLTPAGGPENDKWEFDLILDMLNNRPSDNNF